MKTKTRMKMLAVDCILLLINAFCSWVALELEAHYWQKCIVVKGPIRFPLQRPKFIS